MRPFRETGHALELRDHRVERIGHRDHERARRVFLDRAANVGHHLGVNLEQVVAAHPGFARRSRRDDATIGAFDLLDVGGAGDVDVDAEHRRRLEHVQRLALRQSFDNVVEHDVAESAQEAQMGARRADITRPDERNFLPSHALLLVLLFLKITLYSRFC